MSWGEALENVNYVAALVATLSTLAVGFVWYHQKTFGKDWMKLVGLKEKDLKDNSGLTALLGTSVIFYALAVVAMAAIMKMTELTAATDGALLGAILGFVFFFGPTAVSYGYARRRFELALIDGGYGVVALTVAGLILGLW